MHPSGPERIRWLNKVLPQGVLRFRLSSAEALEEAAQQSTGRRAELTADTREALATLLQSYVKTAKLHPLGEIMTAVNLLSLLKHQLRLNAALNDQLALTPQKITAPLIITGMPRTGSTLLHNLLALDPHWRAPLSWEATRPAPIPGSRPIQRLRYAQTQLRFSLIELLNPGFCAIHELGAGLPQECLVITAAEMRSHLFFSSAFVPDYQDWLDGESPEKNYSHHKRFLQYLQGDKPTNWVLKGPSHLFSLTGLLNTYPDARLVLTHRDPTQVVGSIASLHWHLYRTFSHFTDRKELGRQVCARWAQAHEHANRFSNSHENADRVFSLDYTQFVNDPVESVKHLYAFFGMALKEEVAERMRDYLRSRPQHHFGKHSYNLADYGLDEHAVRAAFGD